MIYICDCQSFSKSNVIHFKEALDNIFKFSFRLNFIYHVTIDCLFTNTKRKMQIFLLKGKKLIFVKYMYAQCLDGVKANLYSCCCLKHGYSKPKCHNLHNVLLIFASVQRSTQTSFRIFLQSRKNGGWCQIQQPWQWRPFFKVDF